MLHPPPLRLLCEDRQHHGAEGAGNRAGQIALQDEMHDPGGLRDEIAEDDGHTVLKLHRADRKEHGDTADAVNENKVKDAEIFRKGIDEEI